jgi:hypothetical protein
MEPYLGRNQEDAGVNEADCALLLEFAEEILRLRDDGFTDIRLCNPSTKEVKSLVSRSCLVLPTHKG